MRNPDYAWEPEGTPGGFINPRILIFHSDCANGAEPHAHDGLEWHFWIGYGGDGHQHVDTGLHADAQYEANGFAISCETASNPDATDRWTYAQLQAMAKLAIWCNANHGIPLKRCDAWNGSGIGYHTMWGSPSHWSPSARTCPGPTRIKQFDEELLPLIQSMLAGDPPHPPLEEDMAVLWKTADNDAVWCVSGAGRWHVPNPECQMALGFGVITGVVVEVSHAVLDGIPIIGAAAPLPSGSGGPVTVNLPKSATLTWQ